MVASRLPSKKKEPREIRGAFLLQNQIGHNFEMADPDTSSKIPGLISLVISGLAFLRPNIEAWYKKAFKKPSLNVICLKQAEIGFNVSGPYIICHLTFLANNQDVVILNANCEVSNIETKETINQSSFMFVSTEFPAGPGTLAKPIFAQNGSAITTQIQFSSWENVLKIKKISDAFREAMPVMPEEPDPNFEKAREAVNSIHTQENFKSTDAIDRLRFWKEGSYKVKITLECQGPCIRNVPEFEFEVTNEFSEKMKTARFRVIFSSLGIPTFFDSDTVPLKATTLPIKG